MRLTQLSRRIFLLVQHVEATCGTDSATKCRFISSLKPEFAQRRPPRIECLKRPANRRRLDLAKADERASERAYHYSFQSASLSAPPGRSRTTGNAGTIKGRGNLPWGMGKRPFSFSHTQSDRPPRALGCPVCDSSPILAM